MKIKITSDSTCDLSPELLRENDIELFPLFINKGDESFRDGVDIQPADIFAHVAAGGALCSTAAVPVGVFHDRFAELAKEYDARLKKEEQRISEMKTKKAENIEKRLERILKAGERPPRDRQK